MHKTSDAWNSYCNKGSRRRFESAYDGGSGLPAKAGSTAGTAAAELGRSLLEFEDRQPTQQGRAEHPLGRSRELGDDVVQGDPGIRLDVQPVAREQLVIGLHRATLGNPNVI